MKSGWNTRTHLLGSVHEIQPVFLGEFSKTLRIRIMTIMVTSIMANEKDKLRREVKKNEILKFKEKISVAQS